MQFSGKSVIITGAGKGIGRACARIMAERGADVIALSRTASDLESLRAEIGARSITVDLGDAKAARAAMAEAGTADFLINSAGINVLESSFDMTDAGYEAVMGINLRAALIACQEFGIARRQPVVAARSSILHQSQAIAALRNIFAMPLRRQALKARRVYSPRSSAPMASASTRLLQRSHSPNLPWPHGAIRKNPRQ